MSTPGAWQATVIIDGEPVQQIRTITVEAYDFALAGRLVEDTLTRERYADDGRSNRDSQGRLFNWPCIVALVRSDFGPAPHQRMPAPAPRSAPWAEWVSGLRDWMDRSEQQAGPMP